MKNNNFVLIISISAIILSVITIILFFYKVSDNSVVNSETFISACIGILGLITTVVIGYQIFNAVEINHKMTKFESQQNDTLNIIIELSNKIKLQEERAKSLNDISEKLVAKNKELSEKLIIQEKEIALAFEDSRARLYSRDIPENLAISVLCQLKVIKLSFEINDNTEDYGMANIFSYISKILQDYFGSNLTGGIKMEDFEAKVYEYIFDIKSVLDSKNLAAYKLCINKIHEAIKIKTASMKENLVGSDAEQEMVKLTTKIEEIEREWKSLVNEINNTQ